MVVRKGLRPDGKLKKGYRFANGTIMKSKKKTCTDKVRNKIGFTMDEYKKDRFNSPEQAIAVGYNMTINENPSCKKYLREKNV